jgi:hypothetical protein
MKMPCGLVGGCQYLGGSIGSIFTLSMEAIHFSEMLVTTYKTTWRHNPEIETDIIYRLSIYEYFYLEIL